MLNEGLEGPTYHSEPTREAIGRFVVSAQATTTH